MRMGTYLCYFGDRTIPEDKWEEFTQRVLTILNQGGMMDLEEVSMFGKKIYLMKPLQIQPGQESLTFCYNYFENDIWETAGYRPGSCRFYTNKVGWRQFDLVCSAVYVLHEFYANSFGMVNRDDHVYDAREIIGWLNHLFGERYTNSRATNLWRIYQLLPDYRKDDNLLPLLPDDVSMDVLLHIVEDEILAAGMAVYPALSGLPFSGITRISFLASLENAFDPRYAFDLLEYSGGMFSTVLPASFSDMDDGKYLEQLLAILEKALPGMSAEVAGRFLDEMDRYILHEVIRWVRFQNGEDELAEDDRNRLEILEELLQRDETALVPYDPTDKEASDLTNLLNSLFLGCAMGCHRDITYLLCDWDGWRDSMGDCPIMREQLTAFAIHALAIHFFHGVLVKMEPTPVIESLMRLYLMTAAPDHTWMTDEMSFRWVREPLKEDA